MEMCSKEASGDSGEKGRECACLPMVASCPQTFPTEMCDHSQKRVRWYTHLCLGATPELLGLPVSPVALLELVGKDLRNLLIS